MHNTGGIRGEYVGHVNRLYTEPCPPVAIVDGSRDDVLRFALHCGECTVVKDEAHQWFHKSHDILEGSVAYEALHRGRHHGVFLMTCTQFPYDLHLEVRQMDAWIYFFRMTSRREVQWIFERTGRREVVELVRRQTGHRPWAWVPGRGLASMERCYGATT